jgi:hypothetical protein
MLEDHFYWSLFADRWLNTDGSSAERLYNIKDKPDVVGGQCCVAGMIKSRAQKMRMQVTEKLESSK